MRLLLIIILGVLVVTFTWGLLVHVFDGNMSFQRYGSYYISEVVNNAAYLGEFVKKRAVPVKRRSEPDGAYNA